MEGVWGVARRQTWRLVWPRCVVQAGEVLWGAQVWMVLVPCDLTMVNRQVSPWIVMRSSCQCCYISESPMDHSAMPCFIHTQIISGLNTTCGFYHWFQQGLYFLLILHLPIALRGFKGLHSAKNTADAQWEAVDWQAGWQMNAQIKNVHQNVEERESIFTVSANVNVCSQYGKQRGDSSKY